MNIDIPTQLLMSVVGIRILLNITHRIEFFIVLSTRMHPQGRNYKYFLCMEDQIFNINCYTLKDSINEIKQMLRLNVHVSFQEEHIAEW